MVDEEYFVALREFSIFCEIGSVEALRRVEDEFLSFCRSLLDLAAAPDVVDFSERLDRFVGHLRCVYDCDEAFVVRCNQPFLVMTEEHAANHVSIERTSELKGA